MAESLEGIAEFDKPREECGVVGVYVDQPENLGPDIYNSLLMLQHRGQEACGIAIPTSEHILALKGLGLVHRVFSGDKDPITLPPSRTASGHVRYGTVVAENPEDAVQPIEIIGLNGEHATIGHNGTIVRQPHNERTYPSDTALLAHNIGANWAPGVSIEEALEVSLQSVVGGYSLVVATKDKLIGVSDPNGLRPLMLGKIAGRGYTLASETPALTAIGAQYQRDIQAGEMVSIGVDGVYTRNISTQVATRRCVFEFVYFMRPDGTWEGIVTQKAREKMGMILAEEAPVDADIVIGVPDSGVPAAIGYSRQSGIEFTQGIVRNRFQGERAFIKPNTNERKMAVHGKLSANAGVVEGKRVVLVDDSIVRGDTMKEIVAMLREAGADEIHARISSPQVANPCFYGIDTGDPAQLLARNMDLEGATEYLGLDSLAHLSQDGLVRAVGIPRNRLCRACFNGRYPTETPGFKNVSTPTPVRV